MPGATNPNAILRSWKSVVKKDKGGPGLLKDVKPLRTQLKDKAKKLFTLHVKLEDSLEDLSAQVKGGVTDKEEYEKTKAVILEDWKDYSTQLRRVKEGKIPNTKDKFGKIETYLKKVKGLLLAFQKLSADDIQADDGNPLDPTLLTKLEQEAEQEDTKPQTVIPDESQNATKPPSIDQQPKSVDKASDTPDYQKIFQELSVEWEKQWKDANAQVTKFGLAAINRCKAFPEYKSMAQERVKEIVDDLTTVKKGMADALAQGCKATADKVTEVRQKTLTLATTYQDHLNKQKADVDDNPFLKIKAVQILQTAVKDVASKLST
ncbi:MAG: hypothetical protein ACFCD0_08395 [Gemmataceae bacterium]